MSTHGTGLRPTGNQPDTLRQVFVDELRPATIGVGGLAALMVLLQAVNTATAGWLTANLGIWPRHLMGLDGIVMAPLLHGGWGHLFANLIPLLVLGVILMASGWRQFAFVTAMVWLLPGIALWLIGPNAITVGASGVIFGWLAYLLARGIFTRKVGQIVLGVVLFMIYGGLFWTGIVKTAFADAAGTTSVSWQGHLFGAIAGVLAAFLVGRRHRGTAQAVRSTPESDLDRPLK